MPSLQDAIRTGLIATVVLCIGCNRRVVVEKYMFWTCKAKGSIMSPDKLTLELRYVEEPADFEYVSGPTATEVCAELSKAGEKTVRVVFDVNGNPWTGVRGYRLTEIAGKEILHYKDILGGGRQGPSNSPHPLSKNIF